MRIEKIGDATLYCGDCLEVLPTLSRVDAVVTDPPYSSGGFTRGDRTETSSAKYTSSDAYRQFESFAGDNRDQRSWILWMTQWLSMAMRVARPGAMMCLFSDWRQLPSATDALQFAGWVWRGIAVWDKISARPMPNRFRAQAEYIVWATNGGREFDTKEAIYHDGVFRVPSPPASTRVHNTEKPVKLLDDLVKVARVGETVADPFMGSGTTGVSCARNGRKFVGGEQVEYYFDIACRRIEEAYKQPRLFGDDELEPVQLPLEPNP